MKKEERKRESEKIRKVVAENIVKCREEKNMTQEEVAKAADLKIAVYKKIESGEHNLRLCTLISIASALGVNPGKLTKGIM